ARHRHVDRLALLEGEVTDRALGRVGIRLDETRGFPDFKLRDVHGALFGAREVWDASSRPGEAGDMFGLQQAPDGLSDFLFGHADRMSRRAASVNLRCLITSACFAVLCELCVKRISARKTDTLRKAR